MTVNEFIRFVLEKIISFYQPEQVYLFGSQASGDANKDSDIDFLIVYDTNESKRMRTLEFRKSLRGYNCYPVDILVYTPDEFEEERKIKGTIAFHAIKEGTMLYGSENQRVN